MEILTFELFLENKESILEKKKNTPTNKKLWDKALRLAKGTSNGGSASVRVDSKTYNANGNI